MCHLGKKHSEEHKRKAGEALGHPVECIETGERFRSSNYAQAMTGIHHINDCCKGNRKTAGKFHWKFVPKTGKHIDIYIENHDQALFIAAAVIVGGRTGAKSLAALAVTLVCLFGVLLPALMKGADTLLMTFIVCAYVAVVSLTIVGRQKRPAPVPRSGGAGVPVPGIPAL